jgi:hypothetical protein
MSIVLMSNIDKTFQPYGILQGCVFFPPFGGRTYPANGHYRIRKIPLL